VKNEPIDISDENIKSWIEVLLDPKIPLDVWRKNAAEVMEAMLRERQMRAL
jgi:hypothetical protein